MRAPNRRRDAASTLLAFFCVGVAPSCSRAPDPTLAPEPTPSIGAKATLDAAANASSPPWQSGFFPPRTLSSFEDKWYSDFLTAMHEPSLRAFLGTNTTVYRFLWLRSFHHPVAIRVEAHGDKYSLTVKKTSGAGGYEPGTVTLRRETPLRPDQWTEIRTALEAAHFRELPSEVPGPGMDGARWILEGLDGDAYRLVQRWTPRPGGPHAAFREACMRMLNIAGPDVIDGQVYSRDPILPCA